jgi:hypothetical protein
MHRNESNTTINRSVAPITRPQALRASRRQGASTVAVLTRPSPPANGTASNGAARHLAASPVFTAPPAAPRAPRAPHHEHPPLVGMPANTFDKVMDCVNFVRARSDLVPQIVIVLGSGLGALADDLEDAISIPYADIPHFHAPGVVGHSGRLVLGKIQVRVGAARACAAGEDYVCAFF